MWTCFDDRRAISSAKSRSSSVVNMDHVMLLFLSLMVFLITQSMATRNKMGEMMQPYLTPDLTANQSVVLLFSSIVHSKSV